MRTPLPRHNESQGPGVQAADYSQPAPSRRNLGIQDHCREFDDDKRALVLLATDKAIGLPCVHALATGTHSEMCLCTLAAEVPDSDHQHLQTCKL